ncbi:MAG: cation:proton antiporter [Psychrilyobacter sp.]|uniref:cation:proton antiporter domain-containing protein n=1 Tax=Psychrilyobacter sp. TaxID=2586924 RepID=UPI003C78E3BF
MLSILVSFLILFVGGVIVGKIVEKLYLPKLIGMIAFGCLANVYLKIIDPVAIEFGGILKNLALVIVLLIAGLGIRKKQIKKVGRAAVLLSLIPVSVEGFTVMFLSIKILGLPTIQAGILGFIIAAVSPAVLVPAMVDLIKRGLGEKKAIPQMLLTGASADDSVAIAMFTSFMGMYFGTSGGILNNLIAIPISTVVGVAVGILVAVIAGEISKKIKSEIFQTILVGGLAIGMRMVETAYHLKYFNSLLGIMVIGYVITNYYEWLGNNIMDGLGKAWSVGAVFLFTLVGTAINPSLVGNIFYIGSMIVFISLTVRSIGVLIALVGTDLNLKERLFCVIAYLPKATVQSAKAGIPLQMGVVGGELIQAMAILSVIITAPIGAIGIRLSASKLLEKKYD